MSQKIRGEGSAAHSSQQPTPVRNGILVTCIDPCMKNINVGLETKQSRHQETNKQKTPNTSVSVVKSWLRAGVSFSFLFPSTSLLFSFTFVKQFYQDLPTLFPVSRT